MGIRLTSADVARATGAAVPEGADGCVFTGVSTDTRTIRPGDLFVALEGEKFDGHAFLQAAFDAGAKGAIVRKGAQASVPDGMAAFQVENTLHALGHVAREHRRRFTFPIGAITGSNGKTTTKEMVKSILAVHGPSIATEGNLNNEVGVPRTLMRLDEGLSSAVVEMGMNHPGELTRLVSYAEPDCAAITCVGAAHLEGLKTVAAVADAKAEIFHGLKDDGLMLVNLDDRRILERAKAAMDGTRRRMMTFGEGEGADVRLMEVTTREKGSIAIVIRHEGRDYPVELNFIGTHNARNACCAFAMGIALGATPEECVRGLSLATGWNHRLSVEHLPFGGAVIDDCYNANPASMAAGLQTLSALAAARGASPVAAVLGDMLELGPAEVESHRRLGKQAAEAGLDFLVTVGPRTIDTWREFVAAAPGKRSLSVPSPDDLSEALAFLKKSLGTNALLLVKGSRGMRLERIVADLTGKAPTS